MIKATHLVPSLKMGRSAFYMNRSVYAAMDIQRRDDVGSGGGFTYENIDGTMRPSFRGIPVNKVDALLETEAQVA
jgi:hypothetical protein